MQNTADLYSEKIIENGADYQGDDRILNMFWERDERALETVAERYGRYCWSVAYGILKNREESDDCVNETYLKLWESIPPNRPDNLKAYIARIAKNIALNALRSLQTQSRGGGELTVVLDELSECVASSDNVEQKAINKELIKAINKFLKTLPQKKRDIFVLRYWYVMSISDIAKRYGCSENSVSVTISRTRKTLTEFLRKRGMI